MTCPRVPRSLKMLNAYIVRFVVRAVPRQHNNEKEIQKDFGKVVDRCLADMVI